MEGFSLMLHLTKGDFRVIPLTTLSSVNNLTFKVTVWHLSHTSALFLETTAKLYLSVLPWNRFGTLQSELWYNIQSFSVYDSQAHKYKCQQCAEKAYFFVFFLPFLQIDMKGQRECIALAWAAGSYKAWILKLNFLCIDQGEYNVMS